MKSKTKERSVPLVLLLYPLLQPLDIIKCQMNVCSVHCTICMYVCVIGVHVCGGGGYRRGEVGATKLD